MPFAYAYKGCGSDRFGLFGLGPWPNKSFQRLLSGSQQRLTTAAHNSGSQLTKAAQKGNDNDPLPGHSHSHIAVSRNSEPGGPCNDPAKWAEASSHPRRAAYSAQPPEPTSARFCCSWPLSFPRLRRSTLLLSGSWWLWPWRLLHSSNPSARCLQDQEMPSCQPSFWPSLSPAQG